MSSEIRFRLATIKRKDADRLITLMMAINEASAALWRRHRRTNHAEMEDTRLVHNPLLVRLVGAGHLYPLHNRR